MSFSTKVIGSKADDTPPDGSEVRHIHRLDRGSMAHFTLPPRQSSKVVSHTTIEDIWCFVGGCGRMWRRLDDQDEVEDVLPAVPIALPMGTHFRFQSDTDEPLEAIGIAMPPWPCRGDALDVKDV